MPLPLPFPFVVVVVVVGGGLEVVVVVEVVEVVEVPPLLGVVEVDAVEFDAPPAAPIAGRFIRLTPPFEIIVASSRVRFLLSLSAHEMVTSIRARLTSERPLPALMTRATPSFERSTISLFVAVGSGQAEIVTCSV